MNESIAHDGKIESILDGSHLQVRIVQTSACASCKIAGHCSSSESKEKIVDVWTSDARNYSVGQDVTVFATNKMGALAVVVGFVIPVIIMMAAISAVIFFSPAPADPASHAVEAMAAITGVLALVPYYVVVYFMRSALQARLSFTIKAK